MLKTHRIIDYFIIVPFIISFAFVLHAFFNAFLEEISLQELLSFFNSYSILFIWLGFAFLHKVCVTNVFKKFFVILFSFTIYPFSLYNTFNIYSGVGSCFIICLFSVLLLNFLPWLLSVLDSLNLLDNVEI